jgi:hypothetical protein
LSYEEKVPIHPLKRDGTHLLKHSNWKLVNIKNEKKAVFALAK